MSRAEYKPMLSVCQNCVCVCVSVFCRVLLRMQIGKMRVPFDGIGRVTFFKNVKFFRIFYIFRNCHFEWLVRNLLAIRCPFNRFPSEVRPFFGYNFSFFSTAHRQIEWGKCRAIEMHNIKFETLISFACAAQQIQRATMKRMDSCAGSVSLAF